jgi:hypothetical protein
MSMAFCTAGNGRSGPEETGRHLIVRTVRGKVQRTADVRHKSQRRGG